MSELLTEPWPWWVGGPALAGLVMLMWLVERRLLGVSGSYQQLVTRVSREEEAAAKALFENPESLQDALTRATLAEFGEEAVASMKANAPSEDVPPLAPSIRPPRPRGVHLIFLVMIAAGGALGAFLSGGFAVTTGLGDTFAELIGTGPRAAIALLIGGLFVGFGTRMAGGCTSGHGLSGCSRFQPGSLLATASFFGMGVVVSLVLAGLAG